MSTATVIEKRLASQQSDEEAFSISTIVAGVEFTKTSLRALDFTMALAGRFEATVQLAHVFGGEDEFEPAASALSYFAEREVSGQLRLEAGKRTSCEINPANCHVRAGKPAAELCAFAREINADLISVATEGRTGLQHFTLGSTAEKVLRHSPCPVLVVRKGGRPWRIEPPEGLVLEKILVPVDFSECAQSGAWYASRFASHVGANLLLVHVVKPTDYMPAEGVISGANWTQLVEEQCRDAEDRLETMINHLPLVGIEAEGLVLQGDPREVLEEQAREAGVDIVITSTHGRTGLAHVFLGSTAEYLVRMAKCPVLVVPSHRR